MAALNPAILIQSATTAAASQQHETQQLNASAAANPTPGATAATTAIETSHAPALEINETAATGAAMTNGPPSAEAEPVSFRPRNTTSVEWNGLLGDPEWRCPVVVAKSDECARPKYSSVDASEYVDRSEVLREKVRLLAQLIRRSRNMVAYTGAGISTSAGLGDYASKAKGSLAGREANRNRLLAEPTLSHRVLAALEKRGRLKEWVQQNHDGLAQKSGYPQEKLNEIHGSWFDRKNPVVLMDDALKPHLYERLLVWTDRSDLTLALGTSLCGMNSDRVARTVAEKYIQGTDDALGLVIIGLQKTPYDRMCTLKIYGKLDDVMGELKREMGLKISKEVFELKVR
eukprot:GDKI01034625.1.p1 GENE.GDKI01034625.1~~GDKI01034625.1.p1  ORF type:complete len:345 (-),score=52.29 GDKI01034625.1:263-1297(-)